MISPLAPTIVSNCFLASIVCIWGIALTKSLDADTFSIWAGIMPCNSSKILLSICLSCSYVFILDIFLNILSICLAELVSISFSFMILLKWLFLIISNALVSK